MSNIQSVWESKVARRFGMFETLFLFSRIYTVCFVCLPF